MTPSTDSFIFIDSVYDNDVFPSEVVARVGLPFEITSDVQFETAEITFEYDESLLGATAEENLRIMWYDEANMEFVIFEDSVVDTVKNTVTCSTTHFSVYMLVDIEGWNTAWGNPAANRASYLASVQFRNGITGKPMSAKKDFEIDNVADFFDDPSNVSTKEKVAIIITDNIYSSMFELKSLIDRGIKAYVIYVGQGFKIENERSQMISAVSATGGELFVIEPNADAASVTDTISRVIASGMERSDGLDSDGDGIFDCVELGGRMLPTDVIVYTDPHKKDTDDDGLSDGEEMRITAGYGTVFVRKDSVNEIRAVVYKAKSGRYALDDNNRI